MTENEKMLPSHWICSKLGEVCHTTSGGTPSRKNPSFYEGSIPWVKSGELNYNIILETEEHISEEAIKKSSAKIFPKGTLLVALYGATIGKLAFLGIDAATNQAVCAIFKNGIFESKFLYYLLFHRRQDLIKEGIGGAQPNISQTILKNLEVPICPLPEQRAIVSKIEQLFSELDNGIANLKLAQEQLKVYRQAVLKKAFEGELTKKWRKANENEDIEHLLSEINEERVEYFKNKGKKIKKVKPISEEEILKLVPLPEDWKRVRLNDLSFLITDGKHGDCRNHDNSGYFFISAKDIFDGKINYANARQIQKEDFEEVHKRTDLQPDDVLVTNAGTIGRIAIATANNKTSKTTFQKSVAIIKKPNSLIDSKYLAYHLENDVERIKMVSKGTAQKNLLLGTMSELIISTCSVREQRQVVQKIEIRLSVCDKIEQDIKENLEKAEALRQSILKKAFEGKLLNEKELAEVRRAEDWEPAEVLLERIRTEKVSK